MIRAKEPPIADPHRGRSKFEEHLPRVLRGQTLEEVGWRKPTALSLLIPMVAGANDEDDYLLRLGFEYYPKWPPSALFVNPDTLQLDATKDLYWLPRIEGDSGLSIHSENAGGDYCGQLICSSFTLEFYRILHDVKEEHLWDDERFTFEATVERIQRSLRSPFYKGRHSIEKPPAPAKDAA